MLSSANPQDLDTLRRLLPMVTRYRWPLVLGGLALLMGSAATLTLPLAARGLIDAGFGNNGAASVLDFLPVLVGVVIVMALAMAIRHYWVTWLGERVVADLRGQIYRRLIHQSPAFYETTPVGELLSRLTADTTLIQTVVGSTISMALRNGLILVGGVAMLAWTSPTLTGVLALLIPLVAAPLFVFGRRLRRLSRIAQDRIADASARAEETLNATATVQSCNQEGAEAARFESAAEEAFRAAMARTRVRAFLAAWAMLGVFGAVLLVVALGLARVGSDTLSPGELGQFLFYAAFVAGSFGVLGEIWGDLQRAAGAAERISELLGMATLPPDDPPGDLPQAAAGPAQAVRQPPISIDFDGVSLTYPSNPQPALHAIDLHVAPGETVALVGPSGAGKSSLFKLLLGFYRPTEGMIRLGGEPIATLSLRALRARLALVPQEPVIFSGTAAENIRYGRPDASDAELVAAAQAAQADGFIRALNAGYGTTLGERGVRLSGGQRQRIAIARAILRAAPVLLLDEATSALDAESEAAVQQALGELGGLRTIMIIAHRLSTVRQADRIALIDRGRVIAIGPHQTLMEREPRYQRLVALQLVGAAESAA